jgi:hypothetical protein
MIEDEHPSRRDFTATKTSTADFGSGFGTHSHLVTFNA